MNQIAIELVNEITQALQSLDEPRTAALAANVRHALQRLELGLPIDPNLGIENGYPVGYFAQTAGALTDEPFEREPQGELQERDDW